MIKEQRLKINGFDILEEAQIREIEGGTELIKFGLSYVFGKIFDWILKPVEVY